AAVVRAAQGGAAGGVVRPEVGPAPLGDVLEHAAPVAQQHRPLAAGRAGGVANGVAVGDDQVLPAVVIDVDEPGAPAHVLLADGADPRAGRVEEEADALPGGQVAVQGVQLVLVVGDPQPGKAAAVGVAGVQPHAAVGV